MKRIRKFIPILLIAAALVTGVGLFWKHTRLYSSPTEERQIFSFFASLGQLRGFPKEKSGDQETLTFDPDAAFERFTLEEGARGIVHYKASDQRRDPEERESRYTKDGNLLGDHKIALIAYSLQLPGDSPAPVRKPDSLEVIPQSELEPDHGNWPMLNLWFRFQNFEFIRAVSCMAGDARTGVLLGVSTNISSSADEEYVHVSFPLSAFHDTPLNIRLNALTGEPVFIPLHRDRRFETVFPDLLRVQWVGQYNNPEFERDDPVLKIIHQPDSAEAELHGVFRVSSERYAREHTGFIGEGNEVIWWGLNRRIVGVNDDQIGHAPLPDQARNNNEPLQMILLPEIAELDFEISGLPDMPNPPETESLFQVKIPHLVLEDKHGYSLLHAVAEIAQLHLDIQINSWEKAGPGERVIRNKTPQQLLDGYIAKTPNRAYDYDEEKMQLSVREDYEKTWIDKARELLLSWR